MDFRTFINTLLHGDNKTRILLWSSIGCIAAGLVFAVIFAFSFSIQWIIGAVLAFLAPALILKDYRLFDTEEEKTDKEKAVSRLNRAILEDAGEVLDIPLKQIEKPKAPAENIKKAEKTDGKEESDNEENAGSKEEPEKHVEKPEKHVEKPEKRRKKAEKKPKRPGSDKKEPEQDRKKPRKDRKPHEKKPAGPKGSDPLHSVHAPDADKGPEQDGGQVREEAQEKPKATAKEKHRPEGSDKVQQKADQKDRGGADKDDPVGNTEAVKKAGPGDLYEAEKSEYKRLMVRYKVKKEHRSVIIDSSVKYKIERCPAYLWVSRGRAHFLLMESSPREIVLDTARTSDIVYEVAPCNPAEEYNEIRTNSAMSELFGALMPTYHDEVVGGRHTSVKNLYVVADDICLTNTSARAGFDLLKSRFVLPDRYIPAHLKGSFTKEAYKTKVLWQDGVINTTEFKARTKSLLQNMTKADISPLEYDNNLREMVNNQLITREYADYYANAQE